jgi:hypothetical protein
MTLLAMMLCACHAAAYSVLTHEELIDLAWNDSIRPLLLARFPGATEAQLRIAHAFAYGGSAIQDMGYYPFGKKFFSNLTHYARTGDFVVSLLREARTINEYAFAIGALSHYLGDSIGHAQAINPATAAEFPKLERKFGSVVTYGESPHAHIRTEFAFDIDELSNSEFAPPAYLRYIGFQVPRKVLERAFADTYGFHIHEVLGPPYPALRSYRTAVRSYIPTFAQAEVVLHRHQFPPHPNDEAYRTFAERVARTNHERNWKHTYHGPGFRAHLLAILVFIVPKIGAISDLAIKIPTSQAEEEYLRSLNHTVDTLRATLHSLLPDPASAAIPKADPPPAALRDTDIRTANLHDVDLPNIDLDTGNRVKRGDYPLADKTYDQLLARLTSRPERTIPEPLKKHLVDFYEGTGTTADLSQQIQEQLTLLKKMKTPHASK